MKHLIKFSIGFIVAGIIVFTSCNPNKELYEMLDNDIKPYSEVIDYTLIDADYERFGGSISSYKAFNDTFPAMENVPEVLAVRFNTLKDGSRAMVTFNYFLMDPIWWNSGFGYELTPDDYDYIGVDGGFSSSDPAQNYLPSFLLKAYSEASDGDEISIIYNYFEADETLKYLDEYEFDGTSWQWLETTKNIPYVGYELTVEDYQQFDGNVGQYGNFSETDPPEDYIPVFLKNKFPFAINGKEQAVKYRYHNGSQIVSIIDLYSFDGVIWEKIPYIEQRSEQYVYGELGWAFDPTVVFQMNYDDYMYLAEIDPIPHEIYDDFGYYYGSSAYYNNFDIRLIGRRLNKDDDGNYIDEELGQIYDNEGTEAAMEEMLRRISEEAIIELLQYKYPDATPQVGGIDVHYIVNFETFADNWIRAEPQVEYVCTQSGSPPQFELIMRY